MKNLIAREIPLGGPLEGVGPLGAPGGAGGAATLFNNIISSVIGLITIIAGIWFVFLLITGAIGIMSAGGDKAAMEEARKRITTGLIGLIVVVAGIFLVDLIGGFLGLDILQPAQQIINLP